jgi:DNA-binding MarR family transcriptional regulator
VSPIDPSVVRIEQAVFRLRRLWTRSRLLQLLREHAEPGQEIQLSNLLVIYSVARSDGEEDCVTVGAVADHLDIDPSTASRLVGQTIEAGYVSRRPSPLDARRTLLRLTDEGRRVKQAADEFRMRFVGEIVTDWTPDERERFSRLLGRFADAVDRIDPERLVAKPGARTSERRAVRRDPHE